MIVIAYEEEKAEHQGYPSGKEIPTNMTDSIAGGMGHGGKFYGVYVDIFDFTDNHMPKFMDGGKP